MEGCPSLSILLCVGCPLTVSVSAGGESGDASRVVCSGPGLAGGVLGRDIRAWLDTRRAGPGELTAHCTGPNKVTTSMFYTRLTPSRLYQISRHILPITTSLQGEF